MLRPSTKGIPHCFTESDATVAATVTLFGLYACSLFPQNQWKTLVHIFVNIWKLRHKSPFWLYSTEPRCTMVHLGAAWNIPCTTDDRWRRKKCNRGHWESDQTARDVTTPWRPDLKRQDIQWTSHFHGETYRHEKQRVQSDFCDWPRVHRSPCQKYFYDRLNVLYTVTWSSRHVSGHLSKL